MAVYRHTYSGYRGPRTPGWHRALVLYREARRAVFHSKVLLTFFVICFAPPLVDLILIYLFNGASFMGLLHIPKLITFSPTFFLDYARTQCFLGYLFLAFAAPGLVAPDLANGGLTLYFARPLRRYEYLLGKIGVLWVLLSCLTWVPGLLLFAVQCEMGGAAWRADTAWVGWGLFVACWIWILVMSLLALAVSAWIKWRVVAGAALIGIYFFGAGFGAILNLALRTQYGDLANIMQLNVTVWNGLFRQSPPPLGLEVWSWIILLALCGFSLFLILRKVRPLQVVK